MKSSFQFSNPTLLNISFKLSKQFEINLNEKISIDVKTETDISRKDESNSAFVVLKLTIGKDDDTMPFYIYAEEGAAFRWNDDSKDVDKLLHQNAPALLLSYLRPTIAMLTAACPYSSYNIPYVNFTERKEDD